jgi:hypothetical protein
MPKLVKDLPWNEFQLEYDFAQFAVFTAFRGRFYCIDHYLLAWYSKETNVTQCKLTA